MGKLSFVLDDGRELTSPQLSTLATLINAEGLDNCHWHFNDCGCCITLHAHDCAFVIGSDGGYDTFPGRGCDCE